MIVQCPACNTKFSIEETMIAGVTNPRFHCSRCDHLFNTKESEVTVEEPTLSPITDLSEPDEFQPLAAAMHSESAEQLSLLPPTEGETGGLMAIERSTGDYDHSRAAQAYAADSFDSDADLPTITADWPDTPSHKIHEANLSHVVDESAQLSLPRRRQHLEQPETLSFNEENSYTMDNDINKDIDETEEEAVETPTVKQTTKPSAVLPTFDDFVLDDPTIAIRAIERVTVANRKRRFGPIALTCSLPALFAAGFYGWSEYLSTRPDTVRNLLTGINQQPAFVAPTGLDITALTAKYITLDNGKQVFEIQGILQNDTLQSISEVKIEAKLFDKHNKPISTLVVDYNNSLTTVSKVSSLREDALELLQLERVIGSNSIKSMDTYPIRIIFTESVEEAAWFSTRVFSAKNPSA